VTSECATTPPPFEELALTPDERAQVQEQLAACFGLTPEAARTWVEVTARHGVCFGRVVGGGRRPAGRASGGRVAASFAAEPLPLARGGEQIVAVMLQSCYVHRDFRGRGYGLERADVEVLRRRFAADVVVLTLFDVGLAPYWRQRGFEVVQRAEEVDLGEYLARARGAFSPAPSERAVLDKLAEVAADGAVVSANDGLVAIRYPGDTVVDELLVRDASRAAEAEKTAKQCGGGSLRIRLKTVMASPGDLELVCAIDL